MFIKFALVSVVVVRESAWRFVLEGRSVVELVLALLLSLCFVIDAECCERRFVVCVLNILGFAVGDQGIK